MPVSKAGVPVSTGWSREEGKGLVPIYEYRCTECGDKTERLESLGHDSSGEKCPSCRAGDIKKVFSLFGTGQSGSSDSCAPPGSSRFK